MVTLKPLVFALLAALCAAPAAAQTPALNLEEARGVTALMDKDALTKRIARACPGDVYGTLVSPPERVIGPRQVANDYCAAYPGECHRLCTQERSPVHCFRLAQTFEANVPAVSPRYKLALFTFACATGSNGGCANRAAGLRNMVYDDDPLRGLSRRSKETCEFRTFRIACDKGDAWGCAMLGQAHRFGEGTPAAASPARTAYQKSCGIDPGFAACTFAKTALAQMSRPARKKR